MTRDLVLLQPDPERSARVVARCRERLAPRAADNAVATSLVLERVVFGGLTLIYLSTIIAIAASIPRLG